MGNLRQWIARLRDRRKAERPVVVDRRVPTRWEVQERLRKAHDDLQKAIREQTGEKRVASNDRQQVVIFSTFQEICRFNLSAGQVRICRNPKHQDAANTELAICDERSCPLLVGVA